jgi:hypothetical protein
VKIASTLQRYCAWSPDKPGQANWSATEIRQVQAELRALLRVARAARHLSLYAPTERWVALKNAQDALDRASGGER